ncbi:proline--tRNA ligase [archaeon]|jgi:prolyl-tRNA synthetase|nr:proline--tRNA ligase [archaeon]MBT7128381.1 proline--tRNA ligase [archaeon]
MAKKKTTFNVSKSENFSEWFSEILQKAEITDLRYGVKGFVVIRPWGALIIDKMYRLYEDELRAKGHELSILPTIIPEENFNKEASHIDGFAPEVFWLDKKQGDSRLAMRPTSETAYYEMFALWIRSYRDLPLKMYQRGSVFRNETKATRPLLRGREFQWIETHNAFATKEDAEAQAQEDIGITEKLMHKVFGVPFFPMKRPKWDTFPGAVYTIGSDSLMPDGKIIQQPSTHLIKQSFPKSFGVKFVDKDEGEKTPWTTCYGPAMSRILASVIGMHGDDSGLVLPYALAPVQVVIVPFTGEGVDKAVLDIEKKLREKGVSVKVDDSDKRPGEKFFHWEMKGVPFRIEVGEKELERGEVSVFIRDNKEKVGVDMKSLARTIGKMGVEYDARLLAKADLFFEDKVIDCSDKVSIGKAIGDEKIARFSFCSVEADGEACAGVIEKEFVAEVRGTRADLDEKASGKCPICGKKNKVVVYAGKSY